VKRLFLLRHAKAIGDKPGVDDEDRALTQRGCADAVRLGRFLREEMYLPDIVLCSPAVRTRATLDLVLSELGVTPVVQYFHDLYLAKSSTLIAMVQELLETTGVAMIVGHNPGLENCARDLARIPDDRKARKRYQVMTEKFPTAALAVIDFDAVDWNSIQPNTGELELFIRPKDLRGEDE
jgi:phosphohistidine phosphatase